MSETLYFLTTFNEKLPVILVHEKVIRDERPTYINVVVDCCPICGKTHEFLADMMTFDRRECGGKSYISLKEKHANYVINGNSRFFKETTS